MAAADIRETLLELAVWMGMDRGQVAEFVRQAPPDEARAALKDLLTPLVRDPPERVLQLMDRVLGAELQAMPVTSPRALLPHPDAKAVVWQGDITTLRVDAIVNAANSDMLGCFRRNHPCIDNAIHNRAGPRLRAHLRPLMAAQGHPEPTGSARLTPGFMLPSGHILHTVGPIVQRLIDGCPPEAQARQLAGCYESCLDLAWASGLRSVAFCCISTGVFGYPQEAAAHVALSTVRRWLAVPAHAEAVDYVVFNVFLDRDRDIYRRLLPEYFPEGAGPPPRALCA
uniref:Macro domain-containing protein n=1 Tax=Eutreptiella gymnastica TaxID=73025 RepID=A0A7S1NS94_9EUGL